MCGIAALSVREPDPGLQEIALMMARQQRHRGPDLQASYGAPDQRVALGHARLSIVDLSALGNQPMANETEDVWVVCNGEIYNHVELRGALQAKGHRFRSGSDTEVLLHLYEERGTDLLEELHGMFAFALYDSTRNLLFCARDRLGKKPLVYAQTAAGVALASEIPAVLMFPGVDTTRDPVALGLYLLRNLRHIPDPWTLYRGMRRLLPGHAMTIRDGVVEKIWRYWNPDFAVRESSPEELRTAFDRAVDMRRVADVEVAALLSGGVDSSGIVHAMRALGTDRLRTYAMGRDADDEELLRARAMADRLGTDHKEYTFDPDRQYTQFEELLRLYGEPIMVLPLTFAYELCQHIRDDGIRVVMTGHGADELFYGYSGNNSLALLSAFLPFVPGPMRPLLRELAGCFAPGSRAREAFLVAASPVGERKAALYKDEARRLWADLLDAPELVQSVEESVAKWLGVWFGDHKPGAYIDEANVVGLMHENSHSVTIAGDLPAMAASVEARCPFLDQELVQLAWRIHYRQKTPKVRDLSQNKWILKKALEGRVPEELLYAPKRGFGYHIQEEGVLRGPWKSRVDQTFASTDDFEGLFNADAIRRLKSRFDRREGVPAILIAKLYALAVCRAQGAQLTA